MQHAYSGIVIERVHPELDCGRHPVKREVGDTLEVSATAFREGHDVLRAELLHRWRGEEEWSRTLMEHVNPGLDLWSARLPLERNARLQYTIEAWTDHFASWQTEVEKKTGAGQRVELELAEGRELIEDALRRSHDPRVRALLEEFDAADYEGRLALATGEKARQVMERHPDRASGARYERVLEVVVDRVRARYGAWYEIFPRSQGSRTDREATFEEASERLPEIADMGFDVVYLTPIHPIGETHRKGPNNTLEAGPGDPGSPYAIGSHEGGHTAVHPALGTLEDFRRFRERCEELGMEVALDIAIQASPDHPDIKEHPEWFSFRADGTIKYAENPPKKYQDIVNFDFYCEARESLWRQWREIFLFWVDQGVKIFRVDNPHTKPIPFWEWVIGEVTAEHPEVIFLSEAFTRPPMLQKLAKVGFTQSYTYFTWRNHRQEFIEYLTELTAGEPAEYLRPNFFTNTPDILPPILQKGGRPAFMMRLVLAATLSPSYGIYSGFELCENEAVPGTEEYADSEKYEIRARNWDAPGNIKGYLKRVNELRRRYSALQELTNLAFHDSGDENILFYSKTAEQTVLVAVNLDPFEPHAGVLRLPLGEMGFDEDEELTIEELLSGETRRWRGPEYRVLLDPQHNPAEIYHIKRA